MAVVEGSPVSSSKLTALGKALDQTSISSLAHGGSASSSAASHGVSSDVRDEMGEEGDEDNEDDDDVMGDVRLKLPTKVHKKRSRTNSLKKMLPAPAPQRPKQVRDLAVIHSPLQGSSGTEEESATSSSPRPLHESPSSFQRSQAQPAKLMVKDRKGSGMGVPRAHLILNAVKQAPPAKEKSNPRRWSKQEDESLRLAVERSGERNWKAIADQVPGRNHTQCLQRWTKVLKPGLIKGHWTPEEDEKLRELVAEGKKNWGQVASLIPGRTSKQCRERWCNHLDPNINKGSYTEDEDKIIVEMQAKLGNRWSIIAQQLKGRTEDAVKIRWKSLMRGRRAASKEEKMPTASSPVAAIVTSSSPLPADRERQKLRPSETSPARQHSHASATIAADTTAPRATEKIKLGVASEKKTLAPALHSDMETVVGGTSNAMHVNDLVAVSIRNFQMSQRFHPSSSAHAGNATYSGSPSHLMSAIVPGIPQSSAMYAMAEGGTGAYNLNMRPRQMPLPPHPSLLHQQLSPSYQYPPGYTMQQSMGGMPNYVVATNFPASNQMQMRMSLPMPVSSPMQSMPSAPTFSSQAMAMAVASAQYQHLPQHASAVHQGFSGAPLHPRAGATGTPSGTAMQSATPPTSSGLAANNSKCSAGGAANGSSVSTAGLSFSPTLTAAAGADAHEKELNTPREEWGSSQTPRSQMIMTEGHASAYELFHQQRLRLMLQERDKQGMTLSSAPSPGQALLTKELEANKERQARQAIMQKGWRSAVDSMVSFNSVSDLSTLDDQQRFDGLLEKVSLSALDPTDGLLDQSVDIIPGDDTVDL
ncbi:unnamed protein product [Hyaloperonospora brassicae]|uniref:Uncharacterized protein n=1 Tax=Hyaloperonospora brassicae TaxID=162125 RepID=A0AAV0UB70_HYABA|nr:unnamed protein product [Hyaloperonospora brassicae]